MTSSIIVTIKGTYFTVIYVTFFYIHYFSVIKALYESKLLVDKMLSFEDSIWRKIMIIVCINIYAPQNN